jgi:hypothetical protein
MSMQNPMDRFKAQLKAFREDDDARWKYEENEVQRQLRILKETGYNDASFKEELKRAGINVSAVEQDSEKELESQKRVFEELRKIEAPPRRHGQKTRILLQENAARSVILPSTINTSIFPPAYEGWGNTEDCGFNLGLGEFNLKRDETGDGWGIQAVAYGTQYCTLWFYYFPPFAGELTVEPHVDFQGDVTLSAHDHWYTSTWAELKLKLHFDLFQHYWDGEAVATIIDERHQNVNKSFWVDDNRVVSKSLSVSAHDIVWIKLTTSLYVVAHSSHAHVACDFRTGSSRRIRVEYIQLRLEGAPLQIYPATAAQ